MHRFSIRDLMEYLHEPRLSGELVPMTGRGYKARNKTSKKCSDIPRRLPNMSQRLRLPMDLAVFVVVHVGKAAHIVTRQHVT